MMRPLAFVLRAAALLPVLLVSGLAVPALVAPALAADDGPIAMPAPTVAEFERGYDVAYPEGAIRIDGRVFATSMDTDRIVEVKEAGLSTWWEEDGCGPTSIVPMSEGRTMITCHLGGYLAIVGADRKTATRIREDASGARIVDPNDSYSDGAGGAYISDAGIFSPFAPSEGSIVHLTADLEAFRVARDIHYANGVVMADPSTLLVSEHLGHHILRFPIVANGNLGEPEVLIDLDRVTGLINTPLSGPDGIEMFDEQSFLVAIYGEGKLLHIGLDGKLLDIIPVRPQFICNVSVTGNELVIAGSYTNNRPSNAGTIDVLHWVPRAASAVR